MSEITKQQLTKKGMKTRQKLLDAAEEIFGEKGYFEASIVEITLKSGVAQGTFYNYFPTKKAIYDELIYQLSSRLRFHIKKAVDEKTTFKEKQKAGYSAFFEWVITHRNLYSIVHQAVLVDMNLYRWYYEKLADGFIKAVEEAVAQMECKPLNPETVAYCMMGIGHYIGLRWIYWEDAEVPKDVLEETIEIIFNGLDVERRG
ncbi:TetR/AcrR family transcriptional regulator [Siminovitchia acidinfaciens]|uniref:TetR/AcrR family transcriptional regulator n=1 Tax=Siminovitchia acidinfaciens TaxID=2321395 RepID=A0A429XX45_9BACI|nr:TetR/AcrR family transcriptional regulator [Siminovitchia acidinfaciens]RST73046.1 TetR/AcrR family transcriptional regulator [Siminovitchia acidinfaciens]VEF48139.1 TetR family transcriptional regulator [Bacillus freudenreichii]